MNASSGFGVRRRLLLAQTLVLIAGGVTTWVVASLVGPPLFREHLHRAGIAHDSNEQFHAEQAYQYATALSIAVAITVAALTAFIVTAVLSRRLQHSVAEVAAAASSVAEGHYDIRVAPPRLGDEFDELAGAFNRMAQRLQAVETTRRQLFGDLAHEIRTPVAVLEAYLEALEDGVKTLDQPTVAMLREQTGRLVRFAADAAALAQAEEARAAIAPGWVDAGEVAQAAAAAIADRYAAKNVTLSTRIDRTVQLWADRQRLAQVLGNLLDNALRHTPAGGLVTVELTHTAGEVMFTVADNGDGIAAEHVPHVFERFYRADSARARNHGGSGIGLAIVKALTEAHGGHVSVASRGPGQGTTFTVTVPVFTSTTARAVDRPVGAPTSS
ncbi:MAG: HAMP domain-containing histidine kinase [Mycolicibacterium rufum]|uniref:histidine kinase n=1 Tax=Mycolicibacterium chlorophenolicum TaxID=37916 RepID=A0A0J6VTT1_9MYCO|nr:HAMP domain-containing sensor histidine kinase [Mycolicibacterium chlorophenolicum]KMO72883.1 Signal transduction histidine-protein kinase BaeS [Mycolicibacterium chlorophenolicum]MBI5340894.1 HAMP domain-containing histidine kinase [Mycolicibacterium rufum]